MELWLQGTAVLTKTDSDKQGFCNVIKFCSTVKALLMNIPVWSKTKLNAIKRWLMCL